MTKDDVCPEDVVAALIYRMAGRRIPHRVDVPKIIQSLIEDHPSLGMFNVHPQYKDSIVYDQVVQTLLAGGLVDFISPSCDLVGLDLVNGSYGMSKYDSLPPDLQGAVNAIAKKIEDQR